MFGFDDERSKDLADVLGNKTCKKIIDYLSDIKEASEKDIADALSIPINTVEYNLNKLIKSGLVEKTKNFFWSVKGRKIDMFKLAKKHIIISPKSKRVDMVKLRAVLPVIFIAVAVIAMIGLIIYGNNLVKYAIPVNIPKTVTSSSDKVKQFNSINEIKDFIDKNTIQEQESNGFDMMRTGSISKSATNIAAPGAVAESSRGGAGSYSQTNVQVEGVDEADIVKNDDKYIYTLSGNTISIVNAYPAETMKKESEIIVNSASNIYVNKDKLIVFSNSYSYENYGDAKMASGSIDCYGRGCGGGYSRQLTNVFVYDIKDRKNPKLEQNYSFDGNYLDSRMIGDYIYVVSSKYIYQDYYDLPVYSINGMERSVPISDVYYFDHQDNNYVFDSISSINLNSMNVNTQVYLVGGTGTIYVSENNIFLTYLKQESYHDYVRGYADEIAIKVLPDNYKENIEKIMDSGDNPYNIANKIRTTIYDYSLNLKGEEKSNFDQKFKELSDKYEIDYKKKTEKTAIHKISIDKDKIKYKSAGDVPGHILNQFSMDEYKDNFRIATTTGEVWGGTSLNHLYILNSDLEIVGSVEDLAKGEKIYSARFIGDRAYIVTFKKVDPLFVIDVSNPKNPKVLGYLKIPGYSDYLHPYDENHVIGIGKEAVDASTEEVTGRNLDFAWYQGVKIALFDITDVEHPKEKAKFVIGDRGTDSPALSDHKAFLFDKEKGILALPINLVEIDRTKYKECTPEERNSPNAYNYCLMPTTYGQQTWQGLYVLNVSLDGISLRGRITHNDPYAGQKYNAAKDEPIGTERKDANGNIWTKFSNTNYGEWRGPVHYSSIRTDYDIDEFPGGINYYHYQDYTKQIQRSLYMDDILYTVSNSRIKANNLNTMGEINSLDLVYNQPVYYEGMIV
jgi:uncharacterized secreted protein with C-terminal beta-propeller domain